MKRAVMNPALRLLSLLLALAPAAAGAQTLSLDFARVSGGGGFSSGGSLSLAGTVGQAEAGQQLTGGGFALDLGFLAVVLNPSANNPPVVTFSATNLIVVEGTGPFASANFATFSPGPPNESSQILIGYTVTNSDPTLFAVQPAIDNGGTLTFTPATNVNGTTTVTVIAQDNGGTANGGVDKSTNTITISVLTFQTAAMGGIPAFALDSLNNTNIGRVLTNATPVSFDTNFIQSATYMPATGLLQILPVAGQDGSSNRTTVMVLVQFSDGTSQVLPVTVTVYQPLLTSAAGDPTYTSTFSTPLFNPQTGLFEQKVRVVNNTPLSFTALRITATNLPVGVVLRNATLTSGGFAYIDYNIAIPPGGSVTFMLEYFSPVQTPFATGLKLELLSQRRVVAPPVNAVMAAVAGFLGYTLDGHAKFYLELPTQVGVNYYVQYQDVLGTPWKTSPVVITGTGDKVQWMDDGPPNTDSLPGTTRFYRIVVGQ